MNDHKAKLLQDNAETRSCLEAELVNREKRLVDSIQRRDLVVAELKRLAEARAQLEKLPAEEVNRVFEAIDATRSADRIY